MVSVELPWWHYLIIGLMCVLSLLLLIAMAREALTPPSPPVPPEDEPEFVDALLHAEQPSRRRPGYWN